MFIIYHQSDLSNDTRSLFHVKGYGFNAKEHKFVINEKVEDLWHY